MTTNNLFSLLAYAYIILLSTSAYSKNHSSCLKKKDPYFQEKCVGMVIDPKTNKDFEISGSDYINLNNHKYLFSIGDSGNGANIYKTDLKDFKTKKYKVKSKKYSVVNLDWESLNIDHKTKKIWIVDGGGNIFHRKSVQLYSIELDKFNSKSKDIYISDRINLKVPKDYENLNLISGQDFEATFIYNSNLYLIGKNSLKFYTYNLESKSKSPTMTKIGFINNKPSNNPQHYLFQATDSKIVDLDSEYLILKILTYTGLFTCKISKELLSKKIPNSVYCNSSLKVGLDLRKRKNKLNSKHGFSMFQIETLISFSEKKDMIIKEKGPAFYLDNFNPKHPLVLK